jgi:hypothetical protein
MKNTAHTNNHHLAAKPGRLCLSLLIIQLGLCGCDTAPVMLDTPRAGGFTATPIFTVGESFGEASYTPPGIVDGLGAFPQADGLLRILANHELAGEQGAPFQLDNGTELTGARISYFDIDPATRKIQRVGQAIKQVRDRRGEIVTSATQINELAASTTNATLRGLNTLCSASAYQQGQYGFVDPIFFTHEEISAQEDHPHGGSIWALDVANGELWALPNLGRGSWENSAALETPDGDKGDGHVALLLSDDLEFGSAPLYLWIGKKNPAGNFIERNGLQNGQLYVWATQDRSKSPEDWHGTGTAKAGYFVPIYTQLTVQAGRPGFDQDGYLDDPTLREVGRGLGAFQFSRPEDLHTNPVNGSQTVFASTGFGTLFPADDWGTLYIIDTEFVAANNLTARATLTVLHDADDYGDFGIRSADNVVWASDGNIYVQEDMATKLNQFGAASGRDASIWMIDPSAPDSWTQIAEINRDKLLPKGAVDEKPEKFGAWETSGIIDVTPLLPAGSPLTLLATVQAHTLKQGPIATQKLLEGGQIVWLTKD